MRNKHTLPNTFVYFVYITTERKENTTTMATVIEIKQKKRQIPPKSEIEEWKWRGICKKVNYLSAHFFGLDGEFTSIVEAFTIVNR